MTVMQKRLLDIIYSMPKELYECGDNWKIIITLGDKYMELYGDSEGDDSVTKAEYLEEVSEDALEEKK